MPSTSDRALARLVDRLDELQALALREGRTWVSTAEWQRVLVPRDASTAEDLERRDDAAKKTRRKALRRLARLGVVLPVATVLDDGGRSWLRLHVRAPAVLALVQSRAAWARAVLYPDDAEPPELPGGDLLDAAQVRALYGQNGPGTPQGIQLLAWRLGVGTNRVRRLLDPASVRPAAPLRVEARCRPDQLTAARALLDAKAPAWRLARALGCSLEGARAWRLRALAAAS